MDEKVLEDFFDMGWAAKLRECWRIQGERAKQVSLRDYKGKPQTIAGVDVAFSKDGRQLYGAACVLSFPGMARIDTAVWSGEVPFPYVEGLLAFREAPAMLRALSKLTHDFDVLMVSGHGVAHERRCGVASHIGVLLDKPAVGVAKNAPGRGKPPQVEVGGWREIFRGGLPTGALLVPDTQHKFYVSVGNAMSLKQAVSFVKLSFDPQMDDPVPVQIAHNLANDARKKGEEEGDAENILSSDRVKIEQITESKVD